MTVNIGLITNAVVTQDELSNLVREMGGEVFANRWHIGHLQHEDAHIWVDLAPENLEEAIRDNGEAVVGKLGGTLHSMIDVNLSSDEGSGAIALQFAIAFMTRWPTILADFGGGLHSRDELLQFEASGKPLWTLLEASIERTRQSRDQQSCLAPELPSGQGVVRGES